MEQMTEFFERQRERVEREHAERVHLEIGHIDELARKGQLTELNKIIEALEWLDEPTSTQEKVLEHAREKAGVLYEDIDIFYGHP